MNTTLTGFEAFCLQLMFYTCNILCLSMSCGGTGISLILHFRKFNCFLGRQWNYANMMQIY